MLEADELEELRELKSDMVRKDQQTSAIIKRQAEQIEQLENLYREEQILRKRYFNMMEVRARLWCLRTRSPQQASEPASSAACAYWD